jgi:hypothetical protein
MRASQENEAAAKRTHRKSSHKRKRTEALMDESFFNSVNHQLINELVGEQQ